MTYPSMDAWRRIYLGTVKKYLEEDNSLVLVIPFYETTDCVRQALAREIPDLDYYIKDGAFAVIDSLKAYFSEIGLMTFADGLLKHALATGRKGLSVFADMGSFNHMQKMHSLLEHEISLPSKYEASLRGFCIYNERNFDAFSQGQKRSVYAHHGNNLLISE